MLSLSSIVEVRVNPAQTTTSGTAFSTGLILAPVSSIGDEDETFFLVTSADDLLDEGFSATDPAYLAAAAYFAASPAPDRLYVALYSGSDTPADALRRVLEETTDFAAVFACESSSARVNAFLDSYLPLAGRTVLFAAATGSVTEAIGENGILRHAYATGSDRVITVFGNDIYTGAALMGTAMGLSRAGLDSAFALCYQALPGALPTDLTEFQIASIKALNGNVYVTRNGSHRLLENGAAASGRRYDEILYLDRIASDLQDAAVSLLTSGSGKLPQTDETSAAFINRFTPVLSAYTAAGVLATGIWRGAELGRLTHGDVLENGFLMWADSYDQQSDADRAAHKAMPIHVALCMAGSVETLVIDVDMSF